MPLMVNTKLKKYFLLIELEFEHEEQDKDPELDNPSLSKAIENTMKREFRTLNTFASIEERINETVALRTYFEKNGRLELEKEEKI